VKEGSKSGVIAFAIIIALAGAVLGYAWSQSREASNSVQKEAAPAQTQRFYGGAVEDSEADSKREAADLQDDLGTLREEMEAARDSAASDLNEIRAENERARAQAEADLEDLRREAEEARAEALAIRKKMAREACEARNAERRRGSGDGFVILPICV